MRPVHDVDVIILMATTLASKRRPADLAEIVAAADLLQGSIPFIEKLGEAIQRLSGAGLIAATEEGFTLTSLGRDLMARQPRKAATEELIAAVRGELAAHAPTQQSAAIDLTQEQLAKAIQTHKAARKTPGKNLLMPKPKPDRHFKAEGRWRRVPADRPRKS